MNKAASLVILLMTIYGVNSFAEEATQVEIPGYSASQASPAEPDPSMTTNSYCNPKTLTPDVFEGLSSPLNISNSVQVLGLGDDGKCHVVIQNTLPARTGEAPSTTHQMILDCHISAQTLKNFLAAQENWNQNKSLALNATLTGARTEINQALKSTYQECVLSIDGKIISDNTLSTQTTGS